MAKSLTEQWKGIARNMSKYMEDKAYFTMRHACDELMKYILENRTFHDVTGNMVQSYGVALFHRGKMVMRLTPYNYGYSRQPKGESLQKEKNFQSRKYGGVYYSGMEVPWDSTYGRYRSYYGEIDIPSGINGAEERNFMFDKMKSRMAGNANIFQVVAFCAVPYADYVQNKKGRIVLQGAGEELDRLVHAYWKTRSKATLEII